jgi:protein-tyrosine phosphatase
MPAVLGTNAWRIENGIYLGDISAAHDTVLLAEIQVKWVLDLSNTLKGSSSEENDGMVTRRIVPIEDSAADSDKMLQNLDECVEFIQTGLQASQVVLIHCTEGKSRSVTALIYFLMRHHNITLQDAWTRVAAIRPEMRPNDGFKRLLIELECTTAGTSTSSMSLRDMQLSLTPANQQFCLSVPYARNLPHTTTYGESKPLYLG